MSRPQTGRIQTNKCTDTHGYHPTVTACRDPAQGSGLGARPAMGWTRNRVQTDQRTLISSISKISALCGGMLLPAPRAP